MDIGINIWPMRVDVAELELALINVAVNARDAMPNGGRFTVRAANINFRHEDGFPLTGDFVQLSLEDTGGGMPPDVLARAFEPLFTTKPKGMGTGLGLPQVFAFCERSGGLAAIDSAIGAGTSVRLYLPRATDRARGRIAGRTGVEESGTPQGLRILLVEDNDEVAAGTEALLQMMGHQVTCVFNADTALRLFDDAHARQARTGEPLPFDLVLSDIHMPGTMNGIDLAEAVLAFDTKLPVILVTGYAEELDRARHVDVRVLSKPFDIALLEKLLQAIQRDLAQDGHRSGCGGASGRLKPASSASPSITGGCKSAAADAAVPAWPDRRSAAAAGVAATIVLARHDRCGVVSGKEADAFLRRPFQPIRRETAMRHTVIGLFDTYSQAEAARDTLVQTGFARETIELQANPEPSVGSATDEVASSGVLANIERFLSSLFASGPRASETARYTEAVRRGAVLVCVNAASESHAELARNTLTRLGATDIGERSPDWDTPPESSRDHSILDELGIGAVMPGTPHTSSVRRTAWRRPGASPGEVRRSPPLRPPHARSTLSADRSWALDAEPFVPPPLAERPVIDPVDEPVTDPLAGDAGRSAIAAGSMPGSGAMMQPSEVVPEAGQPAAGLGRADSERISGIRRGFPHAL